MSERNILKVGMAVWVRVGISRKLATVLPNAPIGRRNRTICVRMTDGKERWVRPDQIERYEGWVA